jgi:hypothetical protein
MAVGFEGLNPVFASRVQALISASGGLLGPGSGHRTVEEQIALRKKNGCPDVWTSPASSCRIPTAIPGRSNHNHGLAMDLVDRATGRAVQGGSKADQWLRANAARFGLVQAVPGEAWHIELIDDDEARGAVNAAMQQGAIGFDMNWISPERTPEDELGYRLDTVMNILTQQPPEADTPEQMTQQGELAQDVTVIGGQPASAPTGSAASGGIKGMVRQMAAEMGWGDDQWGALEELVTRESSWNPEAQNPTSTAYGLFQFLDSTWANYGQKTSDPAAQARAGLAYIRDRYGSPQAALSFHDKNNYY